MAYATVAQLKSYLEIDDQTTFVAGDVDASGDTITLDDVGFVSSLATGDEVEAETTTTLPDPLAADTIYYVIKDTDQAIQLATTSANASAGTAIDLTDGGTGTHTIVRADSHDDLLEDCITRVQALIEDELGIKFESYSQTRYYGPDSVRGLTLYLDAPLQSVTSLLEGDEDATADKTTISSDDYWLLPRNEGPPYWRVQLMADADPSWAFSADGWIELEGTWGYSTTAPSDIVQATLRWAGHVFKQRESPYSGRIARPELGEIEIPDAVPRDVLRILDRYRSPM